VYALNSGDSERRGRRCFAFGDGACVQCVRLFCAGAMLAIAPLGAVVCSVVGFLLGYYVIRDAMVSDNLGQVLYIPWVWAVGLGPWAVAWAILANVVFFGSYVGEIRQYVTGRRAGHLSDPDAVMEMMRMDYDWLKSRKTDE